ncbi:Panacea domain-containing protein [Enterococcus ratti]|nr:type II toxin-antitoxin system antitoxin SocA domain-containing protein [Enterococcus ratti]
MTMRDLADHVIARAQGTGVGITNLQLQKVLYFTLIEGLKERAINKNWLTENYDESFLVWRYGPVIESIYEKYCIYGASKIFESKHENNNFRFLNRIIDRLLNEDVFDLVDESHQHKPWKENKDHIVYGRSDIPYTSEDLLDAAKK